MLRLRRSQSHFHRVWNAPISLYSKELTDRLRSLHLDPRNAVNLAASHALIRASLMDLVLRLSNPAVRKPPNRGLYGRNTRPSFWNVTIRFGYSMVYGSLNLSKVLQCLIGCGAPTRGLFP